MIQSFFGVVLLLGVLAALPAVASAADTFANASRPDTFAATT